jgi:hypothetical protein
VTYTFRSDGVEVEVLGIPEMDDDEERHHDSLYVRCFFDMGTLGRKPDHGDVVSVAEDASPVNALGGPRAIPVGSRWTVYESLADPVGGAYVRLRRESWPE